MLATTSGLEPDPPAAIVSAFSTNKQVLNESIEVNAERVRRACSRAALDNLNVTYAYDGRDQ